MQGRHLFLCAAGLAVLMLPGCKPPPTDAAVARAANLPVASGPSTPLPSPDTTDAVWANGGNALRLVYGVPGQPVLVAIECVGGGSADPRLRITRHARADKDAGGLLAVIGNRRIGRFAVDATMVDGQRMWQGEAPAKAAGWDALGGQREATATVPGAGLVKLNPSPLPMQLVEACRTSALPARSADLA